MRGPPDPLIISGADIAEAMTVADWLEAAERAFRAAAEGKAVSPLPMHVPAERGGFHVKAAAMSLERTYVAVKVNGNFPANPVEFDLPTVQGAIVLADGSDGVLLAIIDSIEVTLRRTAAASALAAKLLARPDSATLLVCGCGMQGRAHIEAMRDVRTLTRFLLWDRNAEAAEALARDVNGAVVDDLRVASLSADVIACCTSANEAFLKRDMVAPGTFIAAVGADNPHKSEIAPGLMAAAAVVADSRSQCVLMGDLHHAIAAGVMAEGDIRAELSDVLVGGVGDKPSADEIIVFDSTGTALLDVAASAAIYEKCVVGGLGRPVALVKA